MVETFGSFPAWNELTSTVSTSYLIFSRATSEKRFTNVAAGDCFLFRNRSAFERAFPSWSFCRWFR